MTHPVPPTGARTAPDPARPLFAGIDIGGTTTQVVVCADDLTVLTRAEVATPAREGGHA
ncbi:hypothetical protein GTY77_10935, partial [Streptomyces sp. SID8380]|nr:hypothetical protein [Streptomyces sp. SID8380]